MDRCRCRSGSGPGETISGDIKSTTQIFFWIGVYFNDGHGNLTYDAAAMPAVSHMSSCIAPNDMDGDVNLLLVVG